MFQVKVSTIRGTAVHDAFIAERSCVIGKGAGSAIVLQGWRVDDAHARLIEQDLGLFVQDLQSRSGTRVNGRPIKSYGPLMADDVVQIHEYQLKVLPRASDASPEQGSKQSAPFSPRPTRPEHSEPSVPTPERTGVNGAGSSIEAAAMHSWRVRLRQALHDQIDLRRINVSALSDGELRDLTSRLLTEILDATRDVPPTLDRSALMQQVVAEAVGLGPLEPLLEREDVSEIMVNGAHEVFFESKGRLQRSSVTFTDDHAVQSIIERIVAPLGRRIDEGSPMVDARLRDGSRVNAIIPPLALKGPCLTIRKFMQERLTASRLVDFGSMNESMVTFMDLAVRQKRNILISGGTGSGKTTLLNVLSNFIPEHERIVTIEDAAELRLNQPNLVSLEARPANQEGRGAVTIRDLVRNSLRMRPDRIVVGECRGGESLDMLQAMNTGHDGSLTTAHANSPRDCLSRLEVMVMMAGMDLPILAIREQIAAAIHLIVQQTRFSCGARRVTSVSEVTGMENGRIQLGEIFRFVQAGYGGDGGVHGYFAPTGLVPEFYEELKARGARIDLDIFRTER